MIIKLLNEKTTLCMRKVFFVIYCAVQSNKENYFLIKKVFGFNIFNQSEMEKVYEN